MSKLTLQKREARTTDENDIYEVAKEVLKNNRPNTWTRVVPYYRFERVANGVLRLYEIHTGTRSGYEDEELVEVAEYLVRSKGFQTVRDHNGDVITRLERGEEYRHV